MRNLSDNEIVDEMKKIPEEEAGSMPNKFELKKASKERSKEQPILQRIIRTLTGGKKPFKEIVINVNSLEKRVAFLDDGVLQDFSVEYEDKDNLVGAIFSGRIQNLEPGLKAAFVNIGIEKNAFLHYWDALPAALDSGVELIRKNYSKRERQLSIDKIPEMYPIGSEVMVQVVKEQIGTKGARVTTNISIPGKFLVLMPYGGECGISKKIEDPKERLRLRKILEKMTIPEGMGVIIRTAGAGKKLRYFIRDLYILLQKWEAILYSNSKAHKPTLIYKEPDLIELSVRDFLTDDVDRVLVDDVATYERMQGLVEKISKRSKSKLHLYNEQVPIYERFNVDRQIEQTFMRHVALPSGGEIVIDETEALTAIDVNTGSHKNSKDGESGNKNYIFQVNIEAAKEISRQVKLRNLGGLIIVDFIDMKNPKDRRKLYETMCDLLQNDSAKTQILPLSALGLMQISRQRHSQSTSRDMRASCPYCCGRSFVKSARTISIEIHRKLVSILKRSSNDIQNMRVYLNPSVLEYLRDSYAQRLKDIENGYDVKLIFRVDPAFHIENFKIIDCDKNIELK